MVSDWIEEVFTMGAPINLVADALSGLHCFMPSTKKRLPTSWKLFATWRRFEVPSRAPPLTQDLLWAMVSRCLQMADFEMASLLALSFHCFLRTGEALAVRPCDLLLGKDSGIVTLPVSKGKTRHKLSESVTIFDVTVVDILHELYALKKAQGMMKVPIWTKSGTAFRTSFYSLCSFFHVEHLGFRCYSLRRGGATSYFKDCGLMEKTLLRGRWASIAVARLYLCDALAQLPHLTATPRTSRLVASYRAWLSTR